MINRYMNRVPYQGTLSMVDVNAVGKVLDQAQKQYDANYSLANQLKNKYLNALPQDRAEADKIQLETEQRIENIVKKYNGDYSQASKDLSSLIFDLQKQYSPGGKAHAIETNYKTYYDSLARERERLQKKEITANQIYALQSFVNREYKGVGEKDPISGSYKSLNMPDLAEYVDANAILDEAFTKTPEIKTKEGRTYWEGDKQFYKEVEKSGKSYNTLNSAFYNALTNNNKYVGYLQQYAYLLGEKDSAEKDIETISSNQAKVRAYENSSDILKGEYSPVYLENLKHQHAMRRLKYNKELKTPSDSDIPVDIGELLNRHAGAPLEVSDVEKAQTFNETWEHDPLTGALIRNLVPIESSRSDLYTAINDGTLKKVNPNVNLNLLNASINEAAARNGFKLDGMPSAVKKNFVNSKKNEIERIYNEGLKNVNVGTADEFAIPSHAGAVLRDQLISRAMSGGTSVFTIKNGNVQEYQKLSDIGLNDELFTKEGKVKEGVRVTHYVIPGAGYSKPAYKVVTPSGDKFFITDQNKYRTEHFNELGNAHAPIWNEGKETGNPFRVYNSSSNTSLALVPKMNYEFVNGVPKQVVKYYSVGRDGSMELITKGDGNTPADIYDVWGLSKNSLMGALPLGASKSDLTKFQYNSQDSDIELE